MFSEIDQDGSGLVDRTELSFYIMKLIQNKNKKTLKSDYLIKLNDLKKFIDGKVQAAQKEMRKAYQLDNMDPDAETDESNNDAVAKEVFNNIQKEIVIFQLGTIENEQAISEIIKPYAPKIGVAELSNMKMTDD